MLRHLKKSINQVHLEKGTFEQIVSGLERELELNGLEAPDELQIKTVTRQATNQYQEKPKPTYHHCEKPVHYQKLCRQLKREIDQAQNNMNNGDKNNNYSTGQTNSNSNNKIPKNTNANTTINKKDRRLGPIYPPCETCSKTTQRNVTLEQTQRIDSLPGTDDRKDRIRSHKKMSRATQMGMFKLQPKL